MDRAERLIRAARPDVARQLPGRAEADLGAILASDADNSSKSGAAARTSRHGKGGWWLVAAAALIVVVVSVGIGPLRPAEARAATPPMLVTQSMPNDSLADVLGELQAKAGGQPDRSGLRRIVTQWWGLASDVDAQGKIVASRVEPRRRVAELRAKGGISSYTDYVARAYDTAGNPVSGADLPVVGTTIETVRLSADQQVFVHAPPIEPGRFGAYLDDALGANSASPPAFNAISGVGALLSERRLTPGESAAFIGYLGTLRDLRLLGSSVDRLGRPVIVMAAPVVDGNQLRLLLEEGTGAILGTEVVYNGSDRIDIASPAVTEYVVWETP